MESRRNWIKYLEVIKVGLFSETSPLAFEDRQPLSQRVSSAHQSCVHRPRHEADGSHLASVEVKNACRYVNTSSYALMEWCPVSTRYVLPSSACKIIRYFIKFNSKSGKKGPMKNLFMRRSKKWPKVTVVKASSQLQWAILELISMLVSTQVLPPTHSDNLQQYNTITLTSNKSVSFHSLFWRRD